jgi:Xaa-Pro aminopeptidase
VAETEYAMRQAGADDNFILIGSGPHNDAMRAPTDRRLEAGDIVIGEITPVVGGQFIQLCRTISIGPPPQVLVEKYDLLLRAYRAAVSRLIVGAPASVVASTINAMLAAAGYREFCYPPYMRTRGHGFGVGSVTPGMVIDEDTTHLLGEHQVIVVHPNQYLPETGYLACGETLLVTSDGSERLSRTDTRLYTNEA